MINIKILLSVFTTMMAAYSVKLTATKTDDLILLILLLVGMFIGYYEIFPIQLALLKKYQMFISIGMSLLIKFA